MISVKAPGKLYIAGEYAVLEQNCPAVLVALDQYVYVDINASSSQTGVIYSKQYSQSSLHWMRKGTKIVIDNRDNPFEYILSAIKYTEKFVAEQGVRLRVFDLHVSSDLDAADGRKYGLGSSAAVTVATVEAILTFYHMSYTRDLLFKIAAIAHYSVQQNGSAGDVAASVYGGWLAYQTFNKNKLRQELRHKPFSDVITEAWPGLRIQKLTPPQGLQLVIGWTQKPASTSQLVDQSNAQKAVRQNSYAQFLLNSRRCVLKMVAGFLNGDIAVIQKQIRENRFILQQFGRMNQIAVEIPRLTKLIDIAERYNGAGKTSGAGGGDCGIVIASDKTNITALKRDWRKVGILPLSFHVHQPVFERSNHE